jgi:hypothetical protein
LVEKSRPERERKDVRLKIDARLDYQFGAPADVLLALEGGAAARPAADFRPADR